MASTAAHGSTSQEAGFFAERADFMRRLDELLTTTDPDAADGAIKWMVDVLTRYQEQPHLLDPHLGGIVGPLMERVRAALRAWHAGRLAEAEAAAAAGLGGAFPLQLHRDRFVAAAFRLLYGLCKTRGHKSVLTWLPHEVADLEPAVQALLCQDASDHTLWETRYGLLLWLSVLVLVPFDLSTADSYASLGGGGSGSASAADGLVATLVSTCASYLSDPGPVRDAAAVCLAKLLTRPDMEGGRLHSFLNAAVDTLAACVLRPAAAAAAAPGTGAAPAGDLAGFGLFGVAAAAAGGDGAFHAAFGGAAAPPPVSARTFLVTGVLQTLAHVAKFGHRRALAGVQGDVFDRVVAITTASSAGASFGTAAGARAAAAGRAGAAPGVQLRSSPLMRKLLVKLAARTGLTYLPPRVQPWRYARGSRSLLLNLAAAGVAGTAEAAAAAADADAGLRLRGHAGAAAGGVEDTTDDGNDVSVPPQMEDIVDALLTGLRDSDTVVRWAAAKGVGRVTGRLPLDLADDVVAAVLALLAPTEGDAAWHGGCLALAELVRRGLLLPKRLPEAVPRVLQALAYDVRRGAHSVGAHVRDAACYVCWAFARAYEPGVMAPHVADLARGMLVTALFDREVNCRRAAAAAFQESVGRQGAGSFPHGLEVLTAADYFTLGNRAHAFTSVAPVVAAFPAYRAPLREHVLGVKIRHWDPAVRALAAKALAALAVVPPVDEAWIADTALPALLAGTTSPELFTRHGCTLALAELVLAVGGVPALALPPALVDEVRNVVVKAEKARAYTGRGGESVRAAMCRLIAAQCLAGHGLSRKAALRLLQTLEECLRHPNGAIQTAAAAALGALAAHALAAPEPALLDKLPRSFAARLRSEDNPAVRRGLALALGALPRPLLLGAPGLLDDVVTALATATRLERVIQKRDAETRRNAAASLAALVRTVGVGYRAVVAVGADGVAVVAADPPAVAAVSEGDAEAPSATAGGSPLARLLAAEAAHPGLSPDQLQRILLALVACAWDYATDNRGDVGSWVRQAAVEGIEAVLAEVQAAAWAQAEVVAALRAPAGAAAAAFAALPLPSAALPTALLRSFPDGLPPALSQPGAAAAAALASATERPSALTTRTGVPLGAHVRVNAGADAGASAGVTGRVAHIAAAGAVVELEVDGGGGILRLPASAVSPAADGVGVTAARAAIVLGPSPLPASIGSNATTTDTRAALLAALTAPGADVLTAYLPPQLLTDVMGAHLRIAAEKLDRLRGAAGEALTRLLHAPPPLPRLPGVPHREALEAALPPPPGLQPRPAAAAGGAAAAAFDGGFGSDFGGEDAEEAAPGETPQAEADAAAPATEEGTGGDTAVATPRLAVAADSGGALLQLSLPHVMFPRLVGLLPLPAYTASLATGLVTSVGGLSETVVRHASGALVGWAAAALRDGRDADVEAVALALLALLKPRRKQLWDRLVDDDTSGVADDAGAATTAGNDADADAGDAADAPRHGATAGRLISAAELGGYSANDPALSRWFADILGTAGGGAGVSGSSDAAAYRVDSRLVTPALKTLDVLLSQGLLACLDRRHHTTAAAAEAPQPRLAFGEEVVAVTRRRLETGADDVHRTLAGAHVLMGLLPFTAGLARVRATLALLDLLGHPFPRVRRAVAEALYTRLLALDAGAWAETTTAAVAATRGGGGGGSDGDSDGTAAAASATDVLELTLHAPDLDASIAVLADVAWDGDASAVALPARDRLYRSLLGLPAPPPGRAMADAGATGTGGLAAGISASGGSGYASLVRDMGY